tara:strand:- start:539 stop:1141 length:603 start_codon:yes stop_codon:yes gene_type:complete
MLELLQEIIKDKITPNQLLLLYAIEASTSYPQINPHLESKGLRKEGYIIMNEDLETGCELSVTGRALKIKYDNFFIKAKKKTNSILMGKDYIKKVEDWRELWPARKLPSGKPARTNVRTLTNNFKWFFENYDYTWEEIFKATNRYIDQYELTDYLYMKTSQYFIAKSDSSKVKLSELADCCDMLKEGLDEDTNHFKERVV